MYIELTCIALFALGVWGISRAPRGARAALVVNVMAACPLFLLCFGRFAAFGSFTARTVAGLAVTWLVLCAVNILYSFVRPRAVRPGAAYLVYATLCAPLVGYLIVFFALR